MPQMNISNNDDLKTPINKRIGHYGYITQPATGVAVVKGQVVVARNFTYKRRFS